MSELKLAAVGAGYFSQFQYEAWDRIDGVQLIGVCNQTLGKAEAVATRYGARAFADFGEMLETTRPDLVDIITPPSTHFDYVSRALEAGAHVICQKPFCENLEQARAVTAKAAELGLTITVHENFRFQPWYREIKTLLQDDTLGQLYQARFSLRPGDGQGPEAYLARQPYFQQMPRFFVHETGVHWVDTFRFLFGKPSWVFGDLRRLNPVIKGEDAGLILFGYDNGFRAELDGNRLSDHVAENRRLTMGEMRIEGEKGTLELSGNGELSLRAFGTNSFAPHAYEWENRNFGGDCVFALQSHVISHLIEGTPLENSAADYLDVIMYEQAIYRSAQGGHRIALSG
ncbi:Gfo/Idh/MocA family oxidoreductase [Devosia rhodophyticola]|uniref:Gfo/Idh/MocA family oxidoreductase n=1 Tax=Devosia rhodophyticola TaxID=3026423 RepID=A0ABY7YT56_9HYPH|nr:Gfo/Idh/MocA family oxidoreductase [Devosia rhodophyticola]WDR04523.1 Gfo/Idh/MocA family oxidoreductase [Devosia rhodophyticola]